MDSLITTTIDTPEYIQQTLDQHFTDVDVASEIAEFGDIKDTRVCTIVEIENDIKAVIVITKYESEPILLIGFVPCNIPIQFSAKEGLRLPYSDAIEAVTVGTACDDTETLASAIKRTCLVAHVHYLDSLLDLDDEPQL